MTQKAKKLRWPAIVGAATIAVACQTGARTPTPVPTLAIENHAFNLDPHRGQLVRVCGRLVRLESRWAVEHVPTRGEVYFHGSPAVFIAPSAGQPPGLDRNGCVTGRIAREDNSIVPPAQRTDKGDAPYDYDWFLHPERGPTS